jgi:hypothetical protein
MPELHPARELQRVIEFLVRVPKLLARTCGGGLRPEALLIPEVSNTATDQQQNEERDNEEASHRIINVADAPEA